jgi:serine/threonine protein kinase
MVNGEVVTPDFSTTGIQIIRLLNRTQQSVVWLAEDTFLSRKVVIKTLLANAANNPTIVEQFKNEGRLLAQLEHPNIVKVFQHITDPAHPPGFLVLEWVRGTPISDLIQNKNTQTIGKPLTTDFILLIIKQLADGLSYLHAHNLVHRDIKPENLIWADNQIKLIDFGIATTANTVAAPSGTLLYQAPETLRANTPPTPESDIYSVGVLITEMMTGKVQRYIHELIDQASVIPPAVKKVLKKATHPDPCHRYVQISTLAQDFEKALYKTPHFNLRIYYTITAIILLILILAYLIINNYITDKNNAATANRLTPFAYSFPVLSDIKIIEDKADHSGFVIKFQIKTPTLHINAIRIELFEAVDPNLITTRAEIEQVQPHGATVRIFVRFKAQGKKLTQIIDHIKGAFIYMDNKLIGIHFFSLKK